MPLTDTQIRTARPRDRSYKLADKDGLHLFLSPTGAKLWRLRFTLHGKDRTFALGAYPLLSLKEARAAALEARRQLQVGTDPVEARRVARASAARHAAGTFGAIADAWKQERSWTPQTRKQYDRLFEREILPTLGRKSVSTITLADVRGVTERASRPRLSTDSSGRKKSLGGVISARHVHLLIGGVLDQAVEDGLCPINVARARVISGRAKARSSAHRPTPYRHLTGDGLRQLLAKLETYRGEPTTTAAIRLLLLCFTRPSELREARWSEFELDVVGGSTWRIPAERMKSRRPHEVPLSEQAVKVLKELRRHTGSFLYLFPNERDATRPMCRSTLQRALQYLGMAATPHGFRHSASTILHEQGFDTLVIERQLAHADRNSVRAAYNKATYLPERRRMLQHWADWLDSLANGVFDSNVVALRARQ